MIKVRFAWAACIAALLASCATPAPPSDPVILQYTAASRPWLSNLYACAEGMVFAAEMRSLDFIDLNTAHLALSLGNTQLNGSSYLIGNEEVFIVINEENPVTVLSQTQAEALFSGSIQNWSSVSGEDAEINLWIYPAEDEIQQTLSVAFSGLPIAPSANLVADQDAMLAAVQSDTHALGILTTRRSESGVRQVLQIADIPVLIHLPADPSFNALSILNCLKD